MKFNELLDRFIDFIDRNRKSIIKFSLSVLGFVLLIAVFFISSDEMTVSKESNQLLKNIERRQYSIAIDYYKSLDRQFSDTKMKRFNNSVSKKINKLLLASGDKYINGEITKEYFIGLINTINSLYDINLNLKDIVEQASRVSELYKADSFKYDVGISYMNIISSLNGINGELDVYKQEIQVVYESRKIYEESVNNQKISKYHEAIEGYDKVLKEDKKYYSLAQDAKKECIDLMHDYYIEQSKEFNKLGNYEEALQCIDYLKPYYEEDEKVEELEKTYQKNLSLYTMTSDDILNLISKRSGKDRKSISINTLQQMVDDKKYYYVELFEHEKLVNELLISPDDKSMYSYKSSSRKYDSNYSDGYFRILDGGKYQFSISDEKLEFILKGILDEKNIKYKSINKVPVQKVDRYTKSEKSLDEILGKQKDLYNYFLINKGFFKKKQLCLVNIYSGKIFTILDGKLEEY